MGLADGVRTGVARNLEDGDKKENHTNACFINLQLSKNIAEIIRRRFVILWEDSPLRRGQMWRLGPRKYLRLLWI